MSDDARTKGRIIETSKPMTRQQALEKAQRVWGIHGAVYCFHETFFEVSVHTRFHYMVSFGTGIRGMRRLLTPRGEAHNDTEGLRYSLHCQPRASSEELQLMES